MSDEKKVVFSHSEVEKGKKLTILSSGKGGGEYRKVLENFFKSGSDAWVVKYHGESKQLFGVVPTLRKFAKEIKLPVKVDLAVTEDNEEMVILFTRIKK